MGGSSSSSCIASHARRHTAQSSSRIHAAQCQHVPQPPPSSLRRPPRRAAFLVPCIPASIDIRPAAVAATTVSALQIGSVRQASCPTAGAFELACTGIRIAFAHDPPHLEAPYAPRAACGGCVAPCTRTPLVRTIVNTPAPARITASVADAESRPAPARVQACRAPSPLARYDGETRADRGQANREPSESGRAGRQREREVWWTHRRGRPCRRRQRRPSSPPRGRGRDEGIRSAAQTEAAFCPCAPGIGRA